MNWRDWWKSQRILAGTEKKTIGVSDRPTVKITCLVFNEAAHHFVRHRLPQRLQNVLYTHKYESSWYYLHTNIFTLSTKYNMYLVFNEAPSNTVYTCEGSFGKTQGAVRRLEISFSPSLISKSNFPCICRSFPGKSLLIAGLCRMLLSRYDLSSQGQLIII